MIDSAHGLNPGQRADRLEGLLIKGPGLLDTSHAHHHRKHIMRIEARIHLLQRDYGSNHQPGACQQDHSESEFRTYQQTAQAVAANSLASAASSFFQRIADVDGGSSPCRY